MVGDAAAEPLDDVVLEVLRRWLRAVDLPEAVLALAHHLGVRELVVELLEGVRDERSVRIHPRVPLLERDPAVEELVDQVVDFGVRGVEGVPADVEDSAVVGDRTTEPADAALLLEDQRITL